jgi:hypothetical protein
MSSTWLVVRGWEGSSWVVVMVGQRRVLWGRVVLVVVVVVGIGGGGTLICWNHTKTC